MPIPQVPSPLLQLQAAKTYNAAWFRQTGDTNAQAVQRAITRGAADNAVAAGTCECIFVPSSLLPYDASQVTFNSAILMIGEGLTGDKIPNVAAYGVNASTPATADWLASFAGAIAYAAAQSAPAARMVLIPASIVGATTFYNASSTIGWNNTVRMIREGGDPTVWDIGAYGAPLVGVAAGQTAVSISTILKFALLGASKSGGGTVSLLAQTGEFGLTSDAWSVLTKTDISPVVIKWGPAVYRLASKQAPMSHHQHILHDTTFIMQNTDGTRVTGTYAFLHTGQGMQLSTTVGSGTVTISGSYASDGTAATLNVGQQISIFGHIPRCGRDNTTIGADPGSSGTSIQVASTTGFPSSGWLVIPNNAATDYEFVRYTSVDATHFNGCTRGYGGSTAVAHNVSTAVDRAVYEPYLIKSVSGNTITLDEGRTVPFTATLIDCNVGVFDFSISGTGVFDGNMDPAVDDTANPSAFYMSYASRCFWSPMIRYKNWDHSCIILNQSGYCQVRGWMHDSTRPSLQLGSATWLFGSARHNDLDINVENCYIGCYIDSRTTGAGLVDGPSDNNSVIIRVARAVYNPIRCSGSRYNYCLVQSAVDMPASGIGIVEDGDAQWITTGNSAGLSLGNVWEVKAADGTAGFLAASVSGTIGGQKNTIIVQRPTIPIAIPAGVIIGFQGPHGSVSLAYGTTVNTDALAGDHFEIIATNGTAFTIANPTNSVEGHEIEYDIYNNSGGALGAITWGSEFNLAGAFTNPANGQRRMIHFRRRNGKWREVSRSAADQPN